MSHFLRVFSERTEPISLGALAAHLQSSNVPLSLTLEAPGATQAMLRRGAEDLAALELDFDNDLVADERSEFLEELGSRRSAGARRVREVLVAMRQIVTFQVLSAGRTDAGWVAMQPALEWLWANAGPVWQADDFGFWERSERLVGPER